MKSALELTGWFCNITKQETEMVAHAQKSLLFDEEEVWPNKKKKKKDPNVDIAMLKLVNWKGIMQVL